MTGKLKSCFSSESINTGRQPELDIAKGFAIIFMVWVHVTEMFIDTSTGVMPQVVEYFLGSPFAAPIFMICMGIGIVYSRRNTPGELAKRGVTLLVIGFVLDLCRYFLPMLLLMAIEGDFSYLSETCIEMISVDILQFAGLAFLFLALMKKLRANDMVLLLVAIAAQILGAVLRYKSTGNYIADCFAGYLWGTDTNTYFPFLTWIIFPVIGIMIGKLYIHIRNKDRFYRICSPICLVSALLYLDLAYIFKFGMYGENSSYYFMGTIDAFFVILLAIGVFGIDHLLLHIFKNYAFPNLIRLSKYINTVYCIHWVLVTLTVGTVYFITENIKFWQSTLIALMILMLADFLANIWLGWKRKVAVNH